MKRIPAALLVFVAFWAATAGLQWKAGAFGSEFAEEYDEPAHHVTGLMLRDYIAAGAPAHPREFAEDYYLHYPKVALGHWPPFFYIVQAVWTLAFPVSRTSVLLLLAALTALLALTLYELLRREFGAMAGAGAGLVMISLPIVQQSSRMVMAEVLVALLAFWAVLCFGRYLDRQNWRDAAQFGIWAALAILTKGTGWLLAMVPVIGMLITRRWRLLSRWSFWLPALIVIPVCGPWYLLAPDARHESVAAYGGAGTWVGSLRGIPADWTETVGLILLPLVLIGLVRVLRKYGHEGAWVGAVSLVASLTIFRAFVPATKPLRHMIAAVPAFMMFAAAGVRGLLDWPPLGRVPRRAWLLTIVVAVGALFLTNTGRAGRKPTWGMTEIARRLLATPELQNSVFLVSSDAIGEGALISEVAMHESRRPGHYVLRASKVLFTISWMGLSYKPLYRSPAEVMELLEEAQVGAVVVDLSTRQQAGDHRLLLETLATYADRWERADFVSAAREIVVYRRTEGRGAGQGPEFQKFIERQRQILHHR